MGRDGSHYHDKGEQDASEGKYDPPGTALDDFLPTDTEKDRADYNQGWRNTTDQKKD